MIGPGPRPAVTRYAHGARVTVSAPEATTPGRPPAPPAHAARPRREGRRRVQVGARAPESPVEGDGAPTEGLRPSLDQVPARRGPTRAAGGARAPPRAAPFTRRVSPPRRRAAAVNAPGAALGRPATVAAAPRSPPEPAAPVPVGRALEVPARGPRGRRRRAPIRAAPAGAEWRVVAVRVDVPLTSVRARGVDDALAARVRALPHLLPAGRPLAPGRGAPHAPARPLEARVLGEDVRQPGAGDVDVPQVGAPGLDVETRPASRATRGPTPRAPGSEEALGTWTQESGNARRQRVGADRPAP